MVIVVVLVNEMKSVIGYNIEAKLMLLVSISSASYNSSSFSLAQWFSALQRVVESSFTAPT